MVICAVISIARIAEFEDHSPLLWSLGTIAVIFVILMFTPLGIFGVFLAWAAMIVAMTVKNVVVGRQL